MPLSRRTLIFGAAAAAAVGIGAACTMRAFRAARTAAFARIAHRSNLLETRFGPLEYAVAGSGRPVLMLHGTGGGFDQGLLFTNALRGLGHQIIAPSRFGYLRSSFPADPSPANQADALVALLDALGIDRLAVIGGSAGALPAAVFAARHPDRCAALVLLVPAMNLENRDPVEMTPVQRILVDRVLGSDFWFWVLLRTAPDLLTGTLLATDPALLDSVSAAEHDRAARILDGLLPISRKIRGLGNDAHYAGHPADIDLAAISAPTLVISAEDDRFGTAGTARTIATRIAGARKIIYPTGGHIWLGHDDAIAAEIAGFLALPSKT